MEWLKPWYRLEKSRRAVFLEPRIEILVKAWRRWAKR